METPRPEILYLPALLRRVETGNIRVPAFQREFVWKRDQMLELLESVYKGYPIGSLLLWEGPGDYLRTAVRGSVLPTPQDVETPIHYILDGQQRIVTMFGALRADTDDPSFSIGFDLLARRFVHIDQAREKTKNVVPLRALFEPRRLMLFQRELLSSGNDALLDRVVELHSKFQEYSVPVVTIFDRKVSEVVEIFERVNRMGTRLNAFDFMRATTWSSDFDLATEVSRVASKVSQSGGISVRDETVAKLLSVSLGGRPMADSMIELRGTSAKKLSTGMKVVHRSLLMASEFFLSELGILSGDYIPYEGHMLVVASMMMDRRSPPGEADRRHLARWIWTTGLTEGLTGKSEFQIAGMIDDAKAGAKSLADSVPTLERKRLVDTLETRKLIKGKAVTCYFIAGYAMREPLRLTDGAPIDSISLMQEYNTARFVSAATEYRERDAARLAATTFIVDYDERAEASSAEDLLETLLTLDDRMGRSQANAVRKSQFVTSRMVSALAAGDVSEFVAQRADLIAKHLIEIAGANRGAASR